MAEREADDGQPLFRRAAPSPEPSDEVVCMFESRNQVLYWVCPTCNAQNNGMSRCTVCNAALPDAVVGEEGESEA